MSPRYTPLPNPRSAPDAQRELDDAFESDNEDDAHLDHESTPTALQHSRLNSCPEPASPRYDVTSSIPGAYDFEREYDYPPPGSPPRPSATALPNDFGNTNGQLPTSPVRVAMPRRSIFRRAMGSILPTHYAPIPTEAQPSRARGGGIENDGVFANVMAKPQRAQTFRTEDGEVHLVPEDTSKEAPPSYTDAQADAVPPYWETTVHAPAGPDANGDMIIDDLPTGSVWIFGLNIFISFFFQFVGFLLTYLMHTTHAAKFGSRAGLGLTLIQFGFYSRSMSFTDDPPQPGETSEAWSGGSDPLSTSSDSNPTPTLPNDTTYMPGVSSRDWLSFLFMTLGWFLLLSSVVGFWRVKRWESSVRAAANRGPVTREDIERDIAIRRNIENVFGISLVDDDEGGPQSAAARREDDRLTRDLRASGLI